MEKSTIKDFTDLIAWQEAHKLVLKIYKITDTFPQKEIYSLTNQMRRAAVSITSNIAEGFSRSHQREKIQFFYTALGSLTELHNQIILSRDIKYIDGTVFEEILISITRINKLVNGLIKSWKSIA